jgi:hypothetical protein
MKFLRNYFYLMPLTLWNYIQRGKGKLPDEWYWADEELFLQGKTVPVFIYKIIGWL